MISASASSLGPDPDRVVPRAASGTLAMTVVAVTAGVALAAQDLRLALLPVAFVLGWLNLAGL